MPLQTAWHRHQACDDITQDSVFFPRHKCWVQCRTNKNILPSIKKSVYGFIDLHFFTGNSEFSILFPYSQSRAILKRQYWKKILLQLFPQIENSGIQSFLKVLTCLQYNVATRKASVRVKDRQSSQQNRRTDAGNKNFGSKNVNRTFHKGNGRINRQSHPKTLYISRPATPLFTRLSCGEGNFEYMGCDSTEKLSWRRRTWHAA